MSLKYDPASEPLRPPPTSPLPFTCFCIVFTDYVFLLVYLKNRGNNFIENGLNLKLRCHEVYYTDALILLLNIMLCSKLPCIKVLNLIPCCISSQFEENCFTEMCSGFEAGSYLRLIDFVYHSTLELRVLKKKKQDSPWLSLRNFLGHARPFVGASQGRSWNHWVVLGALLWAFIAKT